MVLTPPSNGSNYMAINESGDKLYELSNHLGNVLNVVADRKLPVQLGSTGTVDYYVSNVMSYSDYYPFGMQVPNKHGNVSDFRYGFQGMEGDSEVKGSANSYSTEFRQLDPRIGRWLSLDPVVHPNQSPYCSMDNNPIFLIDPLGSNAGDYFDSESGEYLGTDNVPDGLEHKIDKKDFVAVTSDQNYKKSSNEDKKGWLTGLVEPNSTVSHYEYSQAAGCIGTPAAKASPTSGVVKLNPPSLAKTDAPTESTQSQINEASTYLSNNFALSSTGIQSSTDPFSTNTLIGIGMSVGEEALYSEKFGTWMGRNGKVYSQIFNGNGATGGKLGFAKQTSKVLKFGGLLTSAYGYYDNYANYKAGLMTTSSYYIEQGSNTIGCVPLYGTAWTIGWESGKRWGPSTWFGDNDYKWFE